MRSRTNEPKVNRFERLGKWVINRTERPILRLIAFSLFKNKYLCFIYQYLHQSINHLLTYITLDILHLGLAINLFRNVIYVHFQNSSAGSI